MSGGVCLIFNGPNSKFQQIIEGETNFESTINFRDFVSKMDSKESFEKWIEEKIDSPLSIIGYGESFFSIKEHFIENFPYILKQLVYHGYIEKCYLQNPPLSLSKGLKKIFNEDLSEESHVFETFSKRNLLDIYQKYNDKIVGQEDALLEILSTLYPLAERVDEKPVVMMFYGPAGVGKTESAKIINDALQQGNLFRQQLSMFQTGEFGSYLFGGSLDNPSLAKDLINRESNVILFDEFNRCPTTFYSAFFQMFDEGLYVDKNYEVSLKNCVIICTANYDTKEQILSSLGGPLFSRFDHFVQFKPLSIDAKKTLILNKYIELLEDWKYEEREILKERFDINILVENAKVFTNARNIEKGVKGYMSRILVHNMIEEYVKENHY